MRSLLLCHEIREVVANICEGFHICKRFHTLNAQFNYLHTLFFLPYIETLLFYFFVLRGFQANDLLIGRSDQEILNVGVDGLRVGLDVEDMIGDERYGNCVHGDGLFLSGEGAVGMLEG